MKLFIYLIFSFFFLFNTLNGIYALALTKSDRTVDYLSKLSSMMRYSLSEISTDKVPLENEIHTNDLIIMLIKQNNDLQKSLIDITKQTSIVNNTTFNNSINCPQKYMYVERIQREIS